MSKLITVTLDHPLFRGKALRLARTPKYLRFVCSNLASKWRDSLDALDQLDDEPKEEYILAAVIDRKGNIHVDGIENGCRFGRWELYVTYRLVEPQPSQELMRDREQWQAWCLEQERITGESATQRTSK